MIRFISGNIEKRRILGKSSNSLILIFPDYSEDISFYGLYYADKFKEEIGADSIIVAASDERIEKMADEIIHSSKVIVQLSSRKMQNLLRTLSLHVDTMGNSVEKNLYYISDSYPYGMCFKTLIDKDIFDAQYFVWNRIYHRDAFYYAEE